MHLKLGGRVLLILGFLAASLSYGSWVVNRTAFDPSATRSAAHALINAPSVRSALAREVRDALAPKLGRAGTDPKLRTAVNAAVKDPRFVGAFADAIADLHAAILSDHRPRVSLDTRAVTAALRTAVARHDPAIAAKVRTLGTVKIPLGSETKLPHVGGLTRSVGRLGVLAGLLALALIGTALVLAHDAKTFGRVGRRIALLALGPVLVFALLPRLLEAGHGNSQAVAAALLHAYGRRVLFSAAALVVIGVSTWLIAAAIPTLRRMYRPGPAERPHSKSAPPTPAPSAPPAPMAEKLYL
jgi:hypothetical protein